MRTIEILFKNTSEDAVDLRSLGLGTVEPRGEVLIPLEFAAPGRKDNGTRKRSVIEQTAPQMRPADPDVYKAWLAVPEPAPAASRDVSLARELAARQGGPKGPPGVEAARAARAAAQAPAGPQVPPGARALAEAMAAAKTAAESGVADEVAKLDAKKAAEKPAAEKAG